MFDVTLTGAFLAGLISFLSPCVLPMVPFYLSYLAGVSVNTMASDGTVAASVRGRAITGALFFAAGMLTVFVGMGASASAVGQLVRDWFDVLRWIAAALIIGMGLHFLGVFRIGFLNRQWRSEIGDTKNLGFGGAYPIVWNTSKFSSIQLPIRFMAFVAMSTPKMTSAAPVIRSTVPRCRLNRAMSAMKGPTKAAARMKGSVMPTP